RREAIHPLVEQGFQGFGRDVSAGEAGSAGRNYSINSRISAPRADDVADLLNIIRRDLPVDEFVACGLDAFGQQAAGFVISQAPRVGNGQNGKANRNEGTFSTGHGTTSSEAR